MGCLLRIAIAREDERTTPITRPAGSWTSCGLRPSRPRLRLASRLVSGLEQQPNGRWRERSGATARFGGPVTRSLIAYEPLTESRDRPGWGLVIPGHMFLIFRYRRTSGTDLTASSPRAAAAAAIVTAVMFPSVRIACLLLLS